MHNIAMYSESELLFQASGSMKLLQVWMMKMSKTKKDNFDEDLISFKKVVMQTKEHLCDILVYDPSIAALPSFLEKIKELLYSIDTREVRIMQIVCVSIQNQIAYIVNDLDKKRKLLYEGKK